MATRASRKKKSLSCLGVDAWRIFTKEEMRAYLDVMARRTEKDRKTGYYKSILAVRIQLSTLDMYCYLKARFGPPNGFQTFIAKDDSDNWIHWDYNIKAGTEDVYIAGTSREVHFMLTESLADEQWRDLVQAIKADFGRVGKQKSAILKSLEKWVVFPNKFVSIANACAEKHGFLTDALKKRVTYEPMQGKRGHDLKQWEKTESKANAQRSKTSITSLELSLLTPVMAEAFINMLILILCKKEVRENKRQFESFIRSHIDTKVFDLPFKCVGFTRGIDPNSDAFRNFKRVMDKRNHEIHGNVDPEKEQTETVYFDRRRPLFKETGDHIAKFIEVIEKQSQPDVVVQDYEDIYEFLTELGLCLDDKLQPGFWRVMEDSYPGFDLGRKIAGALFPAHVIVNYMQGLRYDDQLAVNW